MMEIIPKITRPGQVLHILGMDDEPRQVMVGQPFSEGDNGAPQAAPPDVTPEIARLKDNLYKFFDLNDGTYSCTVTVGKATATRREEGAMALGNLLPHLPPEMQAKILPDYVKQLSFPGSQAIAEKLEPPAEGQMDPQQAQATIAQLQQELQKLQPEQVKAQTTIQKAQIDAQAKQQATAATLEGKRMDNETKLAIAELGAKIDRIGLFYEERARVGLEGHDVGMSAVQQAHERDMAAASHQRALEQGETAHAQALEASQQQGEMSTEQAEAQRAHEAEMQQEAQNATETGE
jgi:hypothetical protein